MTAGGGPSTGRSYSGPVPLTVVCLVPAAPALLPRLTGSHVPELAAVRAATQGALESLVGTERVVVVAEPLPGSLAGFGAPGARAATAATPAPRAGAGTGGLRGSWPHEVADALLDAVEGAPTAREHRTWADAGTALLAELRTSPLRTGLLLLADGSRTRGPRAPGGQDERGDRVDAELVAALREGRPADVPDAAAVGATAAPAVALLAAAAVPAAVPAAWSSTELLHHEAPLGVCYLVAVRRRGPRRAGPRTPQ